MIDAQEKQLQDGVEYIKGLRAAAKQPDQNWGEVKTFSSEKLSTALETSWLVVEVCEVDVLLLSCIFLHHPLTKTRKTVCAGETRTQAKHDRQVGRIGAIFDNNRFKLEQLSNLGAHRRT